jgi:hypothetical protein
MLIKKKDTNVNLQKYKEKSYQVKWHPNILSDLVLNSEWEDWSTFFSFLNYLRAQFCLRAQPLIFQVKDLCRMWDKSGRGFRLGKEGTEFFGSHCFEFKWEWKKKNTVAQDNGRFVVYANLCHRMSQVFRTRLWI